MLSSPTPADRSRDDGARAAAPIEDRLAAAGLPGLPRTAWLEIDLDAICHNLALLRDLAGPGIPVRPVVKAMRTATAPIPVAPRSSPPAPRASASPPSTRRSSFAPAGIRAPILVLYPPPLGWAAELARSGVAVAAGDLDALEGLIREASGAASPGPPLAIELEVETGLGRGGFVERSRSRRGRDRWWRLAGGPPGRPVDPLPGGRGPRLTDRRSSAASRRPSRPSRRPGSTCRLATRRPARRSSPTASSPMTASDPAWRSTGSCPTSSGQAGHPSRMPRHSGRRWRSYARPVRVADPARGLGHQLRPDLPDRPRQPDRDAASRLRRRLVALAVEPGQRPSSAAGACRSSATWRWTPSWPT